MRTLTVVTWFCSKFFDFLLALSLPSSLSTRAAAFCTLLGVLAHVFMCWMRALVFMC